MTRIRKQFLLLLTAAVAIIPALHAQRTYHEMMRDSVVNFTATVMAYEKQLAAQPPGNRHADNQFARWKELNALRVRPDGTLPPAGYTAAAMERWRSVHAAVSPSLQPVWKYAGPVSLPANGVNRPTGLGRTTCVAFHPTLPNTIFCGTPNGGLWISRSKGQSWLPLSDTKIPSAGVSAVLIDPKDTATIYVGTGDKDATISDGIGVYKSTDGGKNWAPANTGMGNVTVNSMAMNPTNPAIILAATSAGIFRSNNSGKSWSIVSRNAGEFYQVGYRPGSAAVIYAVNNQRFFVSADDGKTWNNGTPVVKTTGRVAFAVSAACPNSVFIINNDASNAVWKSVDGGNHFKVAEKDNLCILNSATDGKPGVRSQGNYDICIAVDPADSNTVYAAGTYFWKSTDGGKKFTILPSCIPADTAIHCDHHFLAWSPLEPAQLFCCNDGGIYYSGNGYKTFTNITAGIGIGMVYRCAVSAVQPFTILTSLQDNGIELMNNTSWTHVIGGDGVNCVISNTQTPGLYATNNKSTLIHQLFTNGNRQKNISGTIHDTGNWQNPIALCSADTNLMLAGFTNIWRCSNLQSTAPAFEQVTTFKNTDTVKISVIRFADADTAYVTRTNGECWRSTDSGKNWKQVTSLPGTINGVQRPYGGFTFNIATNLADARKLWVTYGDTIYYSKDAGTSWEAWNTGLPDLTALSVAYDTTAEVLYCGMWTGVYYRPLNGSTWYAFGKDLPNSMPRDLQVYYAPAGSGKRNKLFVSTYGRGLWETDLPK